MSAANYARLAAVVFAIVAILQLARAAAGWPMGIGVVEVPVFFFSPGLWEDRPTRSALRMKAWVPRS